MSGNNALSQSSSLKVSTDTVYSVVGDTLFTNCSFKLFVHQNLIAGNGTAENGWYKTINFKSDFSWPIWFMRGIETKNNYDYQTDPQKRINDKVRDNIIAGDTLIVTKIKRVGNKRTGYRFVAYLHNIKFPRINFSSTIANAVSTKELMIP